MNPCVQVFMWTYVCISLEVILSHGIAESYGNSVSNTFGDFQADFQGGCTFYFPTSNGWAFNVPTSSATLVIICLSDYSHPGGHEESYWFFWFWLSFPWWLPGELFLKKKKKSDFLSIPWPIKSEYLVRGPRKLLFYLNSLRLLVRFMFENLLGLVLVKVLQRSITNRSYTDWDRDKDRERKITDLQK